MNRFCFLSWIRSSICTRRHTLYHTNKKNPFKQHFFPFDLLRFFFYFVPKYIWTWTFYEGTWWWRHLIVESCESEYNFMKLMFDGECYIVASPITRCKKTCLVDGSVIRITFNVLFALYDREPCVWLFNRSFKTMSLNLLQL